MTGPPRIHNQSGPLGLSLSSSGSLGLPLALTVPATPHPNALHDIMITATQIGLLLRSASQKIPSTYAHIGFGHPPSVCELPASSLDPDLEFGTSCTIYGVLGITNLFHRSYLLVISSRGDVGEIFGKNVYSVKGVTPIPLDSIKAATKSIEGILNSRRLKSKPTVPSTSVEVESTAESSDVTSDDGYQSSLGDPEEQELNLGSSGLLPAMNPVPDAPSSDSAVIEAAIVEANTPSTSAPIVNPPATSESTGVKRLAQRLVFWNKKGPASLPPSTLISGEAPISTLSENAQLSSSAESPPSLVTPNPTGLIKLSVPPLPASQAAPDAGMPSQPTSSTASTTGVSAPQSAQSEDVKRSELEPKILREMCSLFSHEMYFAYDFDITTSTQRKAERIKGSYQSDHLLKDLTGDVTTPIQQSSSSDSGDVMSGSWNPTAEKNLHLPLWRRVDRRFWWNEDLVQGFVGAALHEYVLPVMQGFIQTSSFSIASPSPLNPPDSEARQGGNQDEAESVDVDYIILSRRSRQRAGLRYQRRGIDEDANVANFVETETITRIELEDQLNVFSHVQIRGSIPVFWSQPGVHLKPAPKLDRTASESQLAMRRHFERTVKIYGQHTIVNLSEVTGKEAAVTNAYHDQVKDMDRKDVKYQGFDFHQECKGMKYENISKLIDQLERDFEHQGFFWGSGQRVLSQQNGVFRVNCIDCLDRTNVVESAFARHVLLQQLQACALIPSAQERKMLEIVFNDVWANNGDAISRAYAGTSALKGDYTRTGKRDISGMLNDGMNSLARMYTANFTDYFAQAVIDYSLGHRSLSVFSEFMLNMSATDPRELFRLSKIRAIAIETCSKLVVLEGEENDVRAGWTLFSPTKVNVRVSDMFEEKVLLLTSAALYIVSYDYVLEKIRVVTRVPLGNIVSVQKGAYILSPLQDAGRDVSQNYGFMIGYRPLDQVITRVTSYSVNNIATASSPGTDSAQENADPLSVTIKAPQHISTDSTTTIRPAQPSSSPSAIASPRPAPLHRHSTSRESNSSASAKQRRQPPQPKRSLSAFLTSTLPKGGTNTDIVYVAFKALPVDHTIKEREEDRAINSSGFTQPRVSASRPTVAPVPRSSLDLPTTGSSGKADLTCRQVVDAMCSQIAETCGEAGVRLPGGASLLVEKDIVSLEEARRATPVFGKAEYALKRLLWLGN